jgi:uncharacterized protein DUF3237
MTDRRSFLAITSLALIGGVQPFARGAASGDVVTGPPVGARLPQFEFVYECEATLSPAVELGKTIEGQRRIIPITGGTVRGPKIRAELLNGGWDWNLSRKDGAGSVEAAYYMRTDDGVLIRIVNEGVGGGGVPPAEAANGERFFMFTHPPVRSTDWQVRVVEPGNVRRNAWRT